jgi:hypothetical protein
LLIWPRRFVASQEFRAIWSFWQAVRFHFLPPTKWGAARLQHTTRKYVSINAQLPTRNSANTLVDEGLGRFPQPVDVHLRASRFSEQPSMTLA